MTSLDLLASIESLLPSARDGWVAFIADVRDWGRTEALATSIKSTGDAVILDRPSTTPRSSIGCRFARDADARYAAQLLRGYQAALKAGE